MQEDRGDTVGRVADAAATVATASRWIVGVAVELTLTLFGHCPSRCGCTRGQHGAAAPLACWYYAQIMLLTLALLLFPQLCSHNYRKPKRA